MIRKPHNHLGQLAANENKKATPERRPYLVRT